MSINHFITAVLEFGSLKRHIQVGLIKCFLRGHAASRNPIKLQWVRTILKLAQGIRLVINSCASVHK